MPIGTLPPLQYGDEYNCPSEPLSLSIRYAPMLSDLKFAT